MLAGFLRKKKVELVRCLTQPEIEVPADADFVIEGYVDPNDEPIWEGPFGDHTGYYSLPDWYPRFHITAITHKRNPVYPATIVGIPPQEDAWLGKATERIFLAPIKMTLVPEITDMEMPVEGVFHNLVIARIQKEYAGQGQKVMNAMWGAGQMMFNKILVLADNGVNIRDYLSLAQYVFANLNPASDIYFSQGPTDVLDHSCSKLGFGGKMCIDGTRKYEEEKEDIISATTVIFNKKEILEKYPEIVQINDRLIEHEIPCLLVSVKKNRPGHIKELHQQLAPLISGIKMVLYVEDTVNANDLPVALWRFCNNVDPRRDSVLHNNCMGFDGTIKTKELDNFQRDWPNIIVAAPETIEAVDKKWNALGIGEFIPSPSLKFRDQLYGQEAVASV
jgi:4-hydroxy-3-polyprenylbenzoate decarboxylase